MTTPESDLNAGENHGKGGALLAAAIGRAARIGAEEDRRLPDEHPGWGDAVADRIFGQGGPIIEA